LKVILDSLEHGRLGQRFAQERVDPRALLCREAGQWNAKGIGDCQLRRDGAAIVRLHGRGLERLDPHDESSGRRRR
jgi:hypothetical protein